MSENSEGHSRKTSAAFLLRVNILDFNTCLRKYWKALTFLGTASYQSINL